MARDLLLDAAVRSTLLLLLAALVAAIARRASASFRHRVWATALLGLIAVPLASALAPSWSLPVLPARERGPAPAPSPTSRFVPPAVVAESPPEPVAPPEPIPLREVEPGPARRHSLEPHPPAPRLPDAWALAYSAGAILTSLPLLAGLAINARRRRRSRPVRGDWADLVAGLRATFAIRRRVDVRTGEDAAIPSTWGLFRPVVLLPRESATWPEPTRRAVLAHELAHVRRLDWPVHLLARLAASLAWFHPLAWYALRRLRIEGEHACDDAVVASGERPADYAEQLLALARRLRVPRSPAALGMARTNKLEARMTALFDARRSHARLSARRTLATLGLAALAILTVATARPIPRAVAEDPRSPIEEPARDEPAGRRATVTIRVLEADGGRPVAGAGAFLDNQNRVTDAEGRAEFPSVAPGWQWTHVGAAGFADVSRHVDMADRDVELTFRLHPGADLEGVVRDPEGKPLPHVRVDFGEEPPARLADRGDVSFAQAATDEEGRYRLRNVRRGVDMPLAASRPGYLRHTRSVRLDGPAETIDLVLAPTPAAGVTVEGVVTDAEGRPIPDAEVARQDVEPRPVQARTDPDGRFRLTGLAPDRLGGVVVWARAKGFAPRRVVVADIPNDGRARATIALEPGRTFEAHVVDPEGRPIPGVRVDAHGMRPFDVTATTDEQGRFRFERLPSGDDPDLSFSKPGYASANVRVVSPKGEPLRYAMHPNGLILGRAVDAATGRPLREFRMQSGPSLDRRPDDPLAYASAGGPLGRDVADEEGRFRLDRWSVGSPVTVMISAPGYDPAVIERAVAVPEAEAQVREFRLPPIDPKARTTYAGKLVGPGGEPLAGLGVWLLARRPSDDPSGRRDIDWWRLLPFVGDPEARLWLDWRYRKAVTDEQGRFTFPDVPTDAEVTALWWGDRDAAPGAVEGLHKLDDAARSAIVLAAPKAGRIVVRPGMEASKVRMTPVGFLAPDWTRGPSPADPAEFEADGLTPGDYDIRVFQEPYRASPREVARRTVTLRPGETLRVDLRAEEAKPAARGSVSGLVSAEAGGVEGAEVVLYRPPARDAAGRIGEADLRTTRAGADGRFAFDGVAPGRYRLWASRDGLTSPRDPAGCPWITVAEDGPAPGPVELRLAPGFSLEVRVAGRADGRPIANAQVRVLRAALSESFATDAEGRATLRPLTPGVWSVEVRAEGFAKQERSLELAGPSGPVAFALEPGGVVEGVVRDPSGKPVAGAVLVANPADREGLLGEAASDEEGRFRFANLPRGVDLKLSIWKPGYLRRSQSLSPTEGRVAAEVVLEPRPFGGSLAGVVVDREGRPIAGAELLNTTGLFGEDRRATTGPDGRFLLEDLSTNALGAKWVAVRAKGCAPVEMAVETGPADRPAERTIALEPGHRIEGRVVDDAGRPLAGALVASLSGPIPFTVSRTTGEDGRFAFDSLPEGAEFAARKAGHSEFGRDKLPLDGAEPVVVRLPVAGVIRGRAVDARTGEPIPSFHVRVDFTPKAEPGDPKVSLDPADRRGRDFSTGDGGFRFDQLNVGDPLLVHVSAPGYEDSAADRVVVARPDAGEVREFRLAPVDPASLETYAGRILDEAGRPVAAQVRLLAVKPKEGAAGRSRVRFNWDLVESGQASPPRGASRFLEAATDAEGRFAFEGVPKGAEVSLHWWGRGVAPGSELNLERRDEADRRALAIRAQAAARIVVTVDRGKWPNLGEVRLWPVSGGAPGKSIAVQSDDQARFEFEDLAPIEYNVKIESPYERTSYADDHLKSETLASTRATLRPGETRAVEFR